MSDFSVKDWRDYPNTSTPITAGALEDLERRLSDYTDAAVRQFAEDSGVGKSGLRWVGPYDTATPYIPDDVVSYPDPDIVGHLLTFVCLLENTNFDPITGGTDVLLWTNQAVQYHTSDQLASTSYVTKTITDASDIDGGSDRPAEPWVIDRTAAVTPTLTIRNPHLTRGLNWNIFAGNPPTLNPVLIQSGFTPHGATADFTLPNDTRDIFGDASFDGSGGHAALYGTFDLKLDSIASINPPPPILPPSWAQMGG